MGPTSQVPALSGGHRRRPRTSQVFQRLGASAGMWLTGCCTRAVTGVCCVGYCGVQSQPSEFAVGFACPEQGDGVKANIVKGEATGEDEPALFNMHSWAKSSD